MNQQQKLFLKYKITIGVEIDEPLDKNELDRMKIFKKKHSMVAAGKTQIKSIKLIVDNKDDEELDYV